MQKNEITESRRNIYDSKCIEMYKKMEEKNKNHK